LGLPRRRGPAVAEHGAPLGARMQIWFINDGRFGRPSIQQVKLEITYVSCHFLKTEVQDEGPVSTWLDAGQQVSHSCNLALSFEASKSVVSIKQQAFDECIVNAHARVVTIENAPQLAGWPKGRTLSKWDCNAWLDMAGPERVTKLKEYANELAMGVLFFTTSDVTANGMNYPVAYHSVKGRGISDKSAKSKETVQQIIAAVQAQERCDSCKAKNLTCIAYCTECEQKTKLCARCTELNFNAWNNEDRQFFQFKEGGDLFCQRDCVWVQNADGANYTALKMMQDNLATLIPGKPLLGGELDIPHQVSAISMYNKYVVIGVMRIKLHP
jgi:hypothetical protein